MLKEFAKSISIFTFAGCGARCQVGQFDKASDFLPSPPPPP
jgi:hypothetical protein